MKREVWLLRICFGIAPVNKLVSLTWLLWALRSFWRFTLHYNILIKNDSHLRSYACLGDSKVLWSQGSKELESDNNIKFPITCNNSKYKALYNYYTSYLPCEMSIGSIPTRPLTGSTYIPINK